MLHVKWWLAVLTLTLIHYTVAPAAYAVADGERGTAQEERDYAQRQSESQDLENFEGGLMGLVVAVVVVVALVVFIHYMVTHHHDHMGRTTEPRRILESFA